MKKTNKYEAYSGKKRGGGWRLNESDTALLPTRRNIVFVPQNPFCLLTFYQTTKFQTCPNRQHLQTTI